MIAVGRLVTIAGISTDQKYGRVVSIGQSWRTRTRQEETIYRVRYHDERTGKARVCPDARCEGSRDPRADGCAICGQACWTDQIRPISAHALRAFEACGLVTDLRDGK